MEEEVFKKLEEHDKKLDAIFRSAEKTRKYFLWTIIITVLMFMVPLIALIFVIPIFLQNYAGNLSNLGI